MTDAEIDAASAASETEVPSQHQANKLVRVLTGKPLKFTVRVHLADGSVVEWQSEKRPELKFDNEARALWIYANDYPNSPVMAWSPGMVLLTEENPK